MREVYLDSEFRCHVENDGTMTAVKTEEFDGKCAAFVEGHRIIPNGCTLIRESGDVFHGPVVTPWKDYRILAAAQNQYERDMAEAEAAYQEGVNSV